jgi:outer membrane immunogenic protein
MNIKAVSALASVISLCAVHSVFAADTPVKAPVYKAVPAYVAPSWTGFYVGGSLGARWSNTDSTTISIGGAAPAAPAGNPATSTYNSTAFRYGGYLGYNWQFAPKWVTGIEADFAAGNAEASVARLPGAAAVNSGDQSVSRQKWDAGLRLRLGMLVRPDTLIYATGGAAWQRFESSSTCSTASCVVAPFVGTFDNATTRTGWSIGAGAEVMIQKNWLVRAEYRYADFGTWRTSSNSGAALTIADNKLVTHTAFAGLAYKF